MTRDTREGVTFGLGLMAAVAIYEVSELVGGWGAAAVAVAAPVLVVALWIRPGKP